ncbi:MAG: ankyrin repeat domain-containing protein [Acidobacteriaceae bacterium]|nr:ankyrin repeat domain-containing protein [Acidobacteriaceae bacterium]MBV9501002.1 ankyrin repeat domain-containing protein [Acidobacteriaceae bacterium]
MSDALPLPPRPNLGQYKKLAKDLQQACKSGERSAICNWAAGWAETLARLQGLEITPEVRREIHRNEQRVERQWHNIHNANQDVARCTLARAQFFVARCHGFASWPKFVKHLEGLTRTNSPVSKFERAVDAIVNGEVGTLSNLLSENPELVRARSTREHRSTLLHYISANGIEDFRQKTPNNIVDIANVLLQAGADVNAESNAYGGRSATLGLTATSCHPEEAGVQIALMDLLINRGAVIDGPDGGSAVVGSLRNGRGEAAEFFAKHGARLDLEGAAGVGRLDIVKSFFNDDGSLRPPATPEQMMNGFAWACEFGRTAVVDFLLQKGMQVDARLPHHGQIGLHWAAAGGHANTVKLLLERGSPVNAKDGSFDGTPLDWALYAWGNSPGRIERGHYYEVVALLVRAGAKLDSRWFEEGDEERCHAVQKVRSDSRMQASLRGEMQT